ncbi:alpha/beta hydrolase domain-containing protein [Larsenimonas rhizosphaerae]|uniref:alpha/beta hydrolase domain-containing protein n=1 Tax=Larsenimonas rhizosphaerae TaxID=2944682 RepID=UPI00203345E8|nr:alpha/beta hydrolase domain-containing protein [Larsenimonas rhizosphaerae]MCM2130066.1 alpha/beta hydrolase domain-containing protein [Larsenimonas rhizosphaerae]
MTHLRYLLATTAAASCLLLAPDALEARVTAFDISSTTPMYDGRRFGKAGHIERIEGIAHFAVAPDDERVAHIDGLDRAPTNADGEVEFSTEVVILRPTGQGSGVLFYDVPNRGRNLSLALLNLAGVDDDHFSVDDPGDGFQMRQGHTLVWSGWQAGLDDDMLTLDIPALDGVTGPSRDEFIFDDTETVHRERLSYPAASLDPKDATLTVRPTPEAPRETPDGLSFRYLDEQTIDITRPAGQDAGAIYEFVYPATGARPAGLAFVATSDLVSFLRGNPGHDASSPIHHIDHTIGLGISQSGRFLRDFIYQGFNADAQGRQVFDGAMAHIAGSRKTFTNDRFAQPGRFSRQHEDHDFPGDQFPFSYADTTDPLTGRTGSLLTACRATDTCPKLMHTDTSTEFWQGRASLVSTSPWGAPLTMPDNVRLYFLAGMPHFNTWGTTPQDKAPCTYPTNPLSPAPTMRALASAMQAWVTEDTAPPASAYPGLEPGTLIDPAVLHLPRVQGTVPTPPVNALHVMDYRTTPPAAGAAYPVRVPNVDADGLPQGGVQSPYVAVPVGTYWGWNLRDEGVAAGDLCSLNGSYLPFPAAPVETDSRRPLDTRYKNRDDYLDALRQAANAQVMAGLMLPEDVSLVVEDAPAFPTHRH